MKTSKSHSPQDLTPELAAAVQDLGPKAWAALLAIALDEPRHKSARRDASTRILAVELLVRMKFEEAIEPLLNFLVTVHPRRGFEDDEAVLEALDLALPLLGQAALEPALRLVSRVPEDDRHRLAGMLSGIGVLDERITTLLLWELERDPSYGAFLLKNYGDVRTMDALVLALDRAEVSKRYPDDTIEVLADTVVSLGGTLTSPQQEKLASAVRFRKDYIEQQRRFNGGHERA